MVHELRPIAFPTAIVLVLTLPKNIFVQSACAHGFVTSQRGVSHSHPSSVGGRELGRNCSSVPLAATPGAGLERQQDLPWVSSAGGELGISTEGERVSCISGWFSVGFCLGFSIFPLDFHLNLFSSGRKCGRLKGS